MLAALPARAGSPRTPVAAEYGAVPPAAARRRRFRPAFTLLEVLVVVAILLILAGVGAFATTSYLARAKVSQAKLQMGKIETAVKAYMLNNDGTPPDNLAMLTNPINGTVFLEGGDSAITNPWGGAYTFTMVNDDKGVSRVRVLTQDNNGNQLAWPDR